MSANAKSYSPIEERLNIASHAMGLALSLAALYFLLARALHHGDFWSLFSVGLFGVSLVALYAASTAYHSASAPDRRQRLRIVDHAAIYLLIAGTYTPFSLLVLKGTVGWVIFGVSWLMAALGITLKLFFTGRFTLAGSGKINRRILYGICIEPDSWICELVIASRFVIGQFYVGCASMETI